jgi:hypothetical protein
MTRRGLACPGGGEAHPRRTSFGRLSRRARPAFARRVHHARLILDLSHPPEASVNASASARASAGATQQERLSRSDSSVTFQSVADVIDMC